MTADEAIAGILSVVGEANDGLEAIQQVRELAPDIVVMDINMPNLNGADATQEICATSSPTMYWIFRKWIQENCSLKKSVFPSQNSHATFWPRFGTNPMKKAWN